MQIHNTPGPGYSGIQLRKQTKKEGIGHTPVCLNAASASADRKYHCASQALTRRSGCPEARPAEAPTRALRPEVADHTPQRGGAEAPSSGSGSGGSRAAAAAAAAAAAGGREGGKTSKIKKYQDFLQFTKFR